MPKAGVIAFAFGIPAELHSNRCIANIASGLGLPVFTQIGIRMKDEIPTTQMPGEYEGHWANTMQQCWGAVDWAQANGMHTLWLAAAEPHMPRVLRDMAYAVKTRGASIKLIPCDYGGYVDEDWFRPESGQLRSHNRFWWYLWEVPLFHLLPMWAYLRITSKPL